MNTAIAIMVKEIVVAVVSNPNYFVPTSSPNERIKQVVDLIDEVEKTVDK